MLSLKEMSRNYRGPSKAPYAPIDSDSNLYHPEIFIYRLVYPIKVLRWREAIDFQVMYSAVGTGL